MTGLQTHMKKITSMKRPLASTGSLYLMILPAVLLVFVFNYLPMFGVVIAFQDLRFDKGIFNSPWIGFKNFEFFFKSGKALTLTLNTVGYNVVFLTLNTILEVVFAVIIYELSGKYFKRFLQSAMILPNFISWVVVGGFAYNILNYEYGALNVLLRSVGMPDNNVYADPGAWKFILPAVAAWKVVGYGSIIYLAAITGIDKELYESAYLDGAGIYRRIWYITLPMIIPTIVILVLLSVADIIKGNFEMFYQLVGMNGLLFDATDVIDTYVFRTLVTSSNAIGTAAASGLYQQVVGFVLVISVNYLVKRIAPSYELF